MTALEERALARNDRFLLEFVEAFELCPFARTCRETGRLERRVVPGPALALEPVKSILDELITPAFDHVEVALVILPDAAATVQAFDRFAATLREAHTERVFFIVPFHPDAPGDDQSPERLVTFLRRSPDPTLQFVRASVLERVRGSGSGDTIWFDPSRIGHELPPAREPSLSERIARRDYETVHRVGLGAMRALLDAIRGQG